MNESRASRYQRRRRLGRAAGLFARAAALALLAFTPVGPMLAGGAGAVGRSWPGAAHAVLSFTVFVLAAVLLVELAALPARLYVKRGAVARREPAERPSARAVLAAEGRAVAVALPAVLLSGAAVLASIRIAGAWWWLAAGIAIALGYVAAMLASPVFVAALARARPISLPALSSRLSELARAASVPVSRVDEIPADDVEHATAFVAGIGRRRRIFLASTVVRHWSVEEIAVVVAHELGHHRRGDLSRTLVLDAALLVAGLAAAGVLSGVEGDSLAVLPPIAWVTGAVWVVSAPLRHAQSRHHEREADAFALALTGGADAFSAVIRRLGATQLAEERPSPIARWLTYRHPPIAERLAAADDYRALRES